MTLFWITLAVAAVVIFIFWEVNKSLRRKLGEKLVLQEIFSLTKLSLTGKLDHPPVGKIKQVLENNGIRLTKIFADESELQQFSDLLLLINCLSDAFNTLKLAREGAQYRDVSYLTKEYKELITQAQELSLKVKQVQLLTGDNPRISLEELAKLDIDGYAAQAKSDMEELRKGLQDLVSPMINVLKWREKAGLKLEELLTEKESPLLYKLLKAFMESGV